MKTVVVHYNDLYLNHKNNPVLISDQIQTYMFSDRSVDTHIKNAAVSRLAKMKASYSHFIQVLEVNVVLYDPNR